MLSFLISLCLLVSSFNLCVQSFRSGTARQNAPAIGETSDNASSVHVEADGSIEGCLRENSSPLVQSGLQRITSQSVSTAPSFSRHLMCEANTSDYSPIDPTTTFKPSDKQAECLTTVNITNKIEFRWYYRDNSSKAWVPCYNWTRLAKDLGSYAGPPYDVESHLYIAGCYLYYPRAYKVDVYLDGLFSFTENFEITNGGLDSPRTCEDVANGQPVNIKSLFTAGVDTQVCHFLEFDNMAYFNEETDSSHNFTTVWIEPNGTVYKTHSCTFLDYKDDNASLNYWKCGVISDDSISVDSNTPLGNWRVEVYMDSYFNNTWTQYGPVANTRFIIGKQNPPVKNWTFMVYVDADNSLANFEINGTIHDLGVDCFLELANVSLSPNISVVVQLDRTLSQDERYGNWTGAKRFNVTEGMTPTAENATLTVGDNVDMGDPNTLRDFVNWTITNYPANHFFLVLWDHGSGCMGVCQDTTSGNDTLSLPELSEALNGIPVIIDEVLIDACGASMIETAYQLRDSANILIGPEGLGYAQAFLPDPRHPPAPDETYLTSLSANSSISPKAYANEVVTDYKAWADAEENLGYIQNATIAAVDLTKMTSLIATVDDFATTMNDKETLYHEQISLALNMTKGYPGPYQDYNGYYVDLYNFAWQTYWAVPDQELRNTCSQMMTALENAVIITRDVNDPGTNGLATFFPDEERKYTTFANIYNETAFASDTPWDELVKYHMSTFYSLTIETPYPNLPVRVENNTYTTRDDGSLQVYFPTGFHTVNVPENFSITPDSRAVFTHWNNSNPSTTRTFFLAGEFAVKAEYEAQYRLIMEANFGTTDPSPGEHWYNSSSNITIRATAPSAISGERYSWEGWTQNGIASDHDNATSIAVDGPMNESAAWKHEYYLTITSTFGSPSPPSEWAAVGTTVSESVISPISESSGTQRVCTGWTGTGSVPASGTPTATNFTLNEPSSLQWNWKTEYLLTVHTDPMGLNPQPSISPAGFWYDNYTKVTCTAQQISGYTFQQWSTQSASYPVGVNPINITMDGQYDLIARYIPSQSWLDVLTNPNVMQALLAILGTVITVSLVGGTWFRSRKRRDIVKQFLAEIDDVYLRLRTNPKKCEEELYTLRNTILEGLTGGKITEDNYDILDKRIDKYVNELAEKSQRKDADPGTDISASDDRKQ